MARLLHLVFEARDQEGTDELRRFLDFMRGSIDRALLEIDKQASSSLPRQPDTRHDRDAR